MRRLHYLHQLIHNALARDDGDTLRIARDGLKRGGIDGEVKLSGEPDGAHHAQRVVREGDVGVKRCAYYASAEVLFTSEEVNERAVAGLVDTESHSIDGEVAARQILLQCSVLHDWVAAVARVRFASRSYKLQFDVTATHLSGAVCAENT